MSLKKIKGENKKMTNKIIKVGSFFSGIGSPEKALERLKKEGYIKDYCLEFFSEIDKNAIKSYCAIHNVDESLNIGNIKSVKGEELPYCDIWIGGFPCQDISCAGNMKGFDFQSSTRSSLGWEMIRLLKEVKVKPKVIIFENVENITSKKFTKTLNLFKNDLTDLGYFLYDKVLDARDYGIPQMRRRYFLIAFNREVDFNFPSPLDVHYIVADFLNKTVEEKYYLSSEKCKYNDDKVYFESKKNQEYTYEINLNKFKNGGVCGIDHSCNFNQSRRLYSSKGNIPTLIASNTTEHCKLVVEE